MSSKFAQPVNAETRFCAVYGHPIKHSASPAMQNAGMAALGLNWRYLAFDVPPGQLRSAIAGAGAMGFLGLNLTVPHKLLALDMVDVLDDSARRWGAVNTIRFEGREPGGAWKPLIECAEQSTSEVRSQGFNTDADAIASSLREDLGVALPGARVLVLGVGGAGRVAALKLAGEGVAELFLVNRTRSKAEEVVAEIARRHPGIKAVSGYPKVTVDLVLNATSLGFKANDASPLDEREFSLGNARAVYDMIYRPAETSLLRAARQAGCRTANGIGMLLHQGAGALELWSGRPAPLAVMREALLENVYGGAGGSQRKRSGLAGHG